MAPLGFEPTISAGERPQTYALEHAASGIFCMCNRLIYHVLEKISQYYMQTEVAVSLTFSRLMTYIYVVPHR